jgi:two-component system, NtrC family, response regulator HydG
MTIARPLLLVVDDEQRVVSLIRRVAEEEGFDVVTCSSGRQVLQIAHDRRPDLVMVDMRMPEVGGVEIVRALRAADAKAAIVLMTTSPSIYSAVEAVKLGAADYLTKPFDLQRLKDTFGRVKEEAERRVRMMTMDREVAERVGFAGMVGRSPAMQEVFDLIRRLAPHVRTALISGEPGTGKELVARALHQSGPRRSRRFVAVNCSAVVETLFEPELFGHAPGALNGAKNAKAGLFEAADGSTLFLDEIGDLPLSLQTKLLRVIETGEVTRVGALQPVTVDVRIVCATHRDLAAEEAAGAFRHDLLYRLNVVRIVLPPLRERREDIPYLTAAFVREFSDRFRKPIAGVTLPAERLLNDAPWPGNVRQLRNVIERACTVTEGSMVTEEDIRASIRPTILVPRVPGDRKPASEPARALSSIERQHIMKVIAETGGNKARAARQLGLSRRALYRRLERHGLTQAPARRDS